MPRNPTTGVFTRPTNSFSVPVLGTIIDPSDADTTFDAWDAALSSLGPIGVAAVDPTVAADGVAGYLRGSIWVNTSPGATTGRLFVNTVNTTGAAVWRGLASYDTTSNNLLFGRGTGASLTSGSENILLGNLAGRLLTSGSDNFAAGLNAGFNLTTGLQHTLIGTSAGQAITTDAGHVLVGYQAGLVMNGNTAGAGPWNTGVGHSVLRSMTTGGSNAAFGRAAMLAETIGAFNCGMGHATLFSGVNNNFCTAIGNLAGGGAQSGADASIGFSGDTGCIAIGNTTGKSSTAARTNCIVIGYEVALGAKDNHAIIGKTLSAVMASGRIVDSGTDRTLEATAAGVTLSTSQIYSGYTLRSGPAGPVNDTTPTAALICATFTGPGNAAGTKTLENLSFWWRCFNTTAQVITLLAGAGVTISGTAAQAGGASALWLVKFTDMRSGNEACTFYRTEA